MHYYRDLIPKFEAPFKERLEEQFEQELNRLEMLSDLLVKVKEDLKKKAATRSP